MRKTIDDVKKNILQKEILWEILWAYPIARKLKQSHENLTIQWALECIKIYSFRFKSNNFLSLNLCVQKILKSHEILTPLQCFEMGQEIWYLPGREEVQTAIARLWWSMEAFRAGEEHGGIMQAIMAVELLLPDLSDRDLLDRYLEAAVRIFEEYEFKN